jgi:hypothetical protein
MPDSRKYPREEVRRKELAITAIRRLLGRDASKYAAGGREKRRTRPVPSLPKLLTGTVEPKANLARCRCK